MIMFPKPPKRKKHDRKQAHQRIKLLEELQDFLTMNEIYGCEVCYLEFREDKRTQLKEGCREKIDPAHRHPRDDYYNHPEMLWIKNQVIMAGRAHHLFMDHNREFKEMVFQKLRGDDELISN